MLPFVIMTLVLVVPPGVGAEEKPDPCALPEKVPVIRTGGIGTIQRIQDGDIVIDDRLYRLGFGTQYMTAGGESAWLDAFLPGETVIFELGAGREIRLLREMN